MSDKRPSDDSIMMNVCKRLEREKRWKQAAPIRNQLMREARLSGLDLEDARIVAYTKLDEMFPPIETQRSDNDQIEEKTQSAMMGAMEAMEGGVNAIADRSDVAADRSPARTAAVTGLGDVPSDWLPLPSNAPLSAEIQWCQANRLHCVEERGETTHVDLSRAMAPAPSWAALGWLETSIRAYAKYVDVVAKASATIEDERETMRRERMAIDEVRSLLAEMLEENALS